jgi:glycerol uptake facilitator-like aquaporin
MTDLDHRTTPAPARTLAAARADHLQLARKLLAEGLSTAFLVAIVIGSGIYAQRLSTDGGLQLLENSIAFAGIEPSSVPMFIVAQLIGAAIAVVVARFLHPDLDADSVVVPHEPD